MFIRTLFLLIAIGLSVTSCQEVKEEVKEVVSDDDSYKDTVTIVTNVMDFVMPDTLHAGWHTFQYQNKSKEPHFFLLEKYPSGKDLEDAKTEVIPHFQNGMNQIMEGQMEEAELEFYKLPEWYQAVQFLGGSGIISPGLTSTTTLKLDTGNYIIECYMKMDGGVFHSSMGMMAQFTVLPSEDGAGELTVKPDYKVTIGSEEGISLSDSVISSGKRTFHVKYLNQKVHENFVGHDINIAKVSSEADLDSLDAWMNWATPNGLLGAAPDGVTFLGGVNDMPADGEGYFTVDLESDQRYVLLSETPNAISKDMLVEFTVGE